VGVVYVATVQLISERLSFPRLCSAREIPRNPSRRFPNASQKLIVIPDVTTSY
jgi:hypothetical protein